MLMLVPLCTCAWACTTRLVNVYKQQCEWWRSRCVNGCKQNCEWWRSRKPIYICSICSDQLVDEEESSTYKRTLTTILMCLRSAGGSEAARYTSSQDTLFCYVNSKYEPHWFFVKCYAIFHIFRILIDFLYSGNLLLSILTRRIRRILMPWMRCISAWQAC